MSLEKEVGSLVNEINEKSEVWNRLKGLGAGENNTENSQEIKRYIQRALELGMHGKDWVLMGKKNPYGGAVYLSDLCEIYEVPITYSN